MEIHFPFTSYKLETQMFNFTPAQQRLVREAAHASKTQAQHLIDEIKKHKLLLRKKGE